MDGQTNDSIAVLAYAITVAGGGDELARQLRIDPAQVWSWLGGKGTPPPEVFMKLLDLLERRSFAVQRERRRRSRPKTTGLEFRR
jgi:hypothetical protein